MITDISSSFFYPVKKYSTAICHKHGGNQNRKRGETQKSRRKHRKAKKSWNTQETRAGKKWITVKQSWRKSETEISAGSSTPMFRYTPTHTLAVPKQVSLHKCRKHGGEVKATKGMRRNEKKRILADLQLQHTDGQDQAPAESRNIEDSRKSQDLKHKIPDFFGSQTRDES